MFNILLIYTHCSHYANPTRIVVLIREICNAIITHAMGYTQQTGNILDLLEDKDSIKDAVEMLFKINTVCVTFKEK